MKEGVEPRLWFHAIEESQERKPFGKSSILLKACQLYVGRIRKRSLKHVCYRR